MKKILSILLIAIMFIAINFAILPNVQAANNQENKTVSSSANIVPAKGLDEEDLPANNTTMPKAGLENMSIIAIVVLSLIGAGSFIRAKTIKIK